MDLTRLYNLTTPELREEAERIGVGDTYAMSRGQLIHSIRNKASGGQPAEGLLNKVLGFAKWALKAAQEEPRKEGASVPASASVPVSAPASVPASVPVSAPASVPASEPGSGAAFGAATESENASSTSSGPPSRPPAGVFSKSAGMFEEPFPTLTMARILAEQGHFKRSLAIYAGLLRSEPEDRELSAEVKEVRARSRARRSQAH
ncbi:MAG: hypothetical protein JRH14_13600 [Deltaproteobacteria bacterium]|nr:hypothetical protein [Deltaproteobacteria bacterium]